MNKYESILVFRPDMEDDAREQLLERFKSIIAAQGNVESVDDWGKKRLAYEIEKLQEGYYYLINFEASHDLPIELERNYKISDQVIRYNIIRKDA
ncbi:MAG: 30S ribosomal protein S6 [Tissierellia bacterium]|jgi:small subunit ribosomal protein S6|nr:30S ribosomal protein S6 [Tissierellia bacterium]